MSFQVVISLLIELDLFTYFDEEKDLEGVDEDIELLVGSDDEDIDNYLEQSENSGNDSEEDDEDEELIDDETLHLNLFGTALKNNPNFKKRLMNNPSLRANKLLTELTYNQKEVIGQSEALMSLNEEFSKKYKNIHAFKLVSTN